MLFSLGNKAYKCELRLVVIRFEVADMCVSIGFENNIYEAKHIHPAFVSVVALQLCFDMSYEDSQPYSSQT